MASQDGHVWISYNGEVYNYLELAAELSQLGHQCSWAGTMANDMNVKIITRDLDVYKIDYSNVRKINK